MSDVRGWSVLCNDPVKMMAVYVPEKVSYIKAFVRLNALSQDLCLDMLELVEIPPYEAFHKQTLELYAKLCGYGNSKVAHYLCGHVDQEQLMYAIRNPCKSGLKRVEWTRSKHLRGCGKYLKPAE